jgi:type VI secretion system VasD/TssJ family lipoprotein
MFVYNYTKKIFLLTVFVVLSACSAKKVDVVAAEQKEVENTFPNQTLLLHIKVASQINGANSPLYMVIYQVKTTLPFSELNFETLNHSSYQALANSYVNSTEYYLVPGEQKTLNLKLQHGVKYIGIFADYKKMNLVKWREIISLHALKKKKQVDLRVTEKGIYALVD